MSNGESGVHRLTVEDVKKFAEDLQRVPNWSEEAQEVYDTLFNYFSHMIVRCRDCIYGIENGELCGRKVYLCSAMTNPNEFYGDFYCKSGERRGTNE